MRMLALLIWPFVLAAAPGPQAPSLPAWMAGSWAEDSSENWSDETWVAPRGGMMLGVSRSGKGDTVDFWELARIDRGSKGGLSFWASPRGRPASEFPLTSSGANEIVFSNSAHDYPQRIRYRREGDVLIGEISLIDGSKPQSWRFRRR